MGLRRPRVHTYRAGSAAGRRWQAPLVWTTLSLTIHADGRVEGTMTGHSRFPRHWIYGNDGRLTHKSGSPTSRTGTASPLVVTLPGAIPTPSRS